MYVQYSFAENVPIVSLVHYLSSFCKENDVWVKSRSYFVDSFPCNVNLSHKETRIALALPNQILFLICIYYLVLFRFNTSFYLNWPYFLSQLISILTFCPLANVWKESYHDFLFVHRCEIQSDVNLIFVRM